MFVISPRSWYAALRRRARIAACICRQRTRCCLSRKRLSVHTSVPPARPALHPTFIHYGIVPGPETLKQVSGRPLPVALSARGRGGDHGKLFQTGRLQGGDTSAGPMILQRVPLLHPSPVGSDGGNPGAGRIQRLGRVPGVGRLVPRIST